MGIFDARQLSTQDHLDIEDIRDDLVVLKNGKVSVVIETDSLNFELLDGREQDARIYSFASFLNAIEFPIQIVIRSQRTDIVRYLKLLDRYKAMQGSEAINNQVNMYQQYIKDLTQNTQILDKKFYMVIPSNQLPIVTTSWLRQLFGRQKRIVNINPLVQKAKDELHPKRDQVLRLFGNLGVGARQLKVDELIKLYYTVYEPDISGQELLNISDEAIDTGFVTGSAG